MIIQQLLFEILRTNEHNFRTFLRAVTSLLVQDLFERFIDSMLAFKMALCTYSADSIISLTIDSILLLNCRDLWLTASAAWGS